MGDNTCEETQPPPNQGSEARGRAGPPYGEVRGRASPWQGEVGAELAHYTVRSRAELALLCSPLAAEPPALRPRSTLPRTRAACIQDQADGKALFPEAAWIYSAQGIDRKKHFSLPWSS